VKSWMSDWLDDVKWSKLYLNGPKWCRAYDIRQFLV
jgi:hypothetical protein